MRHERLVALAVGRPAFRAPAVGGHSHRERAEHHQHEVDGAERQERRRDGVRRALRTEFSRARLHPIDEAERARRAQARTLEGAIHRGLPEILRDHAGAIAEDYPKHWRQSGGYRLDRLAARTGFDLASFVTGSEGTLVAITEATVGLVELPKARQFAIGHFDSVDAAIAATHERSSSAPRRSR